MTWLPIDTALKDGTAIVAFAQPSGCWWVGEAYYATDAESWYAMNNDPCDSWGGPIYPTHWMPLPDPPGEK